MSAVTWQGSLVIREFSVAEVEALKHTAGKNSCCSGAASSHG